jgi:hypothetical protein
LNKSCGEYDSRLRKRLTLSCDIANNDPNLQQLTPLGSLSRKPIYIGNVQRAVDGLVIVLITIKNPLFTCFALSDFLAGCQCVTSILLNKATKFQRTGPVFIRKVRPDEIGTKLVTYIKDIESGLPKIEGEGVILSEGMFILRNPKPIYTPKNTKHDEPIFNEYVSNDLPYMIKNYGQNIVDELTYEFQLKRKKGQFQAILITKELFQKFVQLDCVDADGRIHIAVDFKPAFMYAYQGGWLNSSGYAIGADEMLNYEPVKETVDALLFHGFLASCSEPTQSNTTPLDPEPKPA